MNTLAMFAKHPRPGTVKSRLAADTSTDWAAQVADAFTRDLVLKLNAIDADRIIAYAPDDQTARVYFADLAKGRFTLTPQPAGDLGQRLATFVEEHFRIASRRLVIIGSDSPSVPVAHIEDAFRRLDNADVVLGPATDGGYYLVGCRRPVPIFTGITWSGPEVLRQTVACVERAGLRLALLSPWYDVDTLVDWQNLQGHIAAMRAAGIDPEMPCTGRLLT